MIAKTWEGVKMGDRVWLGAGAVRKVVAIKDHHGGEHCGFVEVYFDEGVACIDFDKSRAAKVVPIYNAVPQFRPCSDFYWATDSAVLLSRNENASIERQLKKRLDEVIPPKGPAQTYHNSDGRTPLHSTRQIELYSPRGITKDQQR